MYILVNLYNDDGYVCSDDLWISLLDLAQSYGWKPKGTRYDFIHEMEECSEDNDDEMTSLFTLISINNRRLEWNGSYSEKENQIVRKSDAVNLYQALKITGIDPELLSFIKQGSFRILSS